MTPNALKTAKLKRSKIEYWIIVIFARILDDLFVLTVSCTQKYNIAPFNV